MKEHIKVEIVFLPFIFFIFNMYKMGKIMKYNTFLPKNFKKVINILAYCQNKIIRFFHN